MSLQDLLKQAEGDHKEDSVDDCAKSVMEEQDKSESEAYAICNAEMNDKESSAKLAQAFREGFKKEAQSYWANPDTVEDRAGVPLTKEEEQKPGNCFKAR